MYNEGPNIALQLYSLRKRKSGDQTMARQKSYFTGVCSSYD
jgi:hypothetical protein